MPFHVYSFADVRTTIYHPSVGQCVLSSSGLGKITVYRAGDQSSHTATADGYVVINRLRSVNGTVTLEVPINSTADKFLRRWANYLKNIGDSSRFGKTSINIEDRLGGYIHYLDGVTPQRIPDRVYDEQATSVTWTLLVASISSSDA